jgi:molecular chaperone GrpE
MATDENVPSDERMPPAEEEELTSRPNAAGPDGPDTNASEAHAPASAAQPEEADALRAKLADLEAEVAREREAAADYLRRWQQAQADLSNYRRRAQQEQEQQKRLATRRALALMLPAIDSFERAFATLPPSLRGYSWISGIALVEMQLQSVLAASGVTEIPAAPGAPFNPQHHEAVGEMETAEHPEGHIAAVLQRGYSLEEVVIRPALVQLARAPQPAPIEGEMRAEPPPSEEPSATGDGPDGAPAT